MYILQIVLFLLSSLCPLYKLSIIKVHYIFLHITPLFLIKCIIEKVSFNIQSCIIYIVQFFVFVQNVVFILVGQIWIVILWCFIWKRKRKNNYLVTNNNWWNIDEGQVPYSIVPLKGGGVCKNKNRKQKTFY